jgi:nucleoside-diphosphate-sugar epimerase
MTELSGLKAVVTGGASGIGLATARTLAAGGGRRSPSSTSPRTASANRCSASGPTSHTTPRCAAPCNRPPTGSAAWTSS